MELRDILVFLHILGAAGWIGGGMFALYGFGRLAKVGDSGAGRAMEAILEKASIYFGVVFLLVVGAGVALVLTEEQWTWGDTFIWVGIGGIVISGIWQGVYQSKRDEAMVEAVKSDSPDRVAVVRSWRRTNWVDLAILLVVLWAMVVKLGT